MKFTSRMYHLFLQASTEDLWGLKKAGSDGFAVTAEKKVDKYQFPGRVSEGYWAKY